MSGTVKSTEAAENAIRAIQNIINGGLTEQINQLDNNGRILSDPNNWDGPLAITFRSTTWPETKSALDKASQELTELSQQLEQIARNSVPAGGR